MKTKKALVTPEMAERWLSMNTNNRPLRSWWVNEIANAIRRGEFQFTHQGIAFDTNRVLIDGQHRLAAIVQSGIAVTMMVSWDAPPESFQALDIGQKRSVSFLINKPSYIVSVSRALLAIAAGDIHARLSCSAAQINMAAEKLDLLNDPIMQINVRYRRRHIAAAPVTVAALTVARMHPQDSHKIAAAYEAASQLDFKSMPPSVQALWTQLSAGSAKVTERLNILARSYIAFYRCRSDPGIPDNSKRQLVIVNPEKHVQTMVDYWSKELKDCL